VSTCASSSASRARIHRQDRGLHVARGLLEPSAMRRLLLPLAFVAACTTAEHAGERVDRARAPFTSARAVLLDFDFDGQLEADTQDPTAVRSLVVAQLLFTTGQLNAEYSSARMGALDLSELHATPIAGAVPARWTVTYHARLPVAWGGATRPREHGFTLPARVGQADQELFATKYGASCAAGSEARYLYLFFQPRSAGCSLAAEDVVTVTASVRESAENTRGKSPEYDRVWEDGALRVTAIFSRQLETETPGDEGVFAYESFLARMQDYLGELQPDADKRTDVLGAVTSKLTAELPGGRRITIDATLVGAAMTAERSDFDAWYEEHTPNADLVLYNGHAGLGSNIQLLMGKGTFRPGQYLIWFANGCDTFVYVDRTLLDRRALLNPDDPRGTKYLDTVTNAMPGYFSTLEAASTTFVRALVDRYETYEQILANIDPEQVAVVTGEEDNGLAPGPANAIVTNAAVGPSDAIPAGAVSDPMTSPNATSASPRPASSGCGVVRPPSGISPPTALALLLATLLARRPRRR
jgi:hypothetical protein